MTWFLYNILFVAVALCLLPYYLLRMRRRGGYARHFWQRAGRYEPELKERLREHEHLWIHAVSVGELFIALKLMDELRRADVPARFVLSVTTSTAHALAREKLPPEDTLIYFPVDIPPVVRRVLDAVRPRALVLMECELWPNLIRHCAQRGIPVAVVNGRVSDNSYRGYRRVRFLTRRLLPAVSLFCVQSRTDQERLVDLGAVAGRVQVLGSAKYDVAAVEKENEAEMRAVLRAAGITEKHTVLLGGSTWEGEEAALLDIYKELRAKQPGLALVLVPRHAERRDAVVEAIRARGFEAILRSTLDPSAPAGTGARPGVLLVDTTGELRRVYGFADIIFVGKSLTQHGGQNILEAAAYGRPVVVGPNMENFPVVMADFLEAKALLQVGNKEELRETLARLAAHEEERRELGERAASLVEAKRGALETTAELIRPLLQPASARKEQLSHE